jgi:hypothetical protein
MKYGKLMILTIFIFSLLCISAASAADDVSGDIVGMDDNEELALDESISDVSANADDDKEVLQDNDTFVSEDDNGKPKVGTFKDLDDAINGNSDDEVTLTRNYTFSYETDDT